MVKALFDKLPCYKENKKIPLYLSEAKRVIFSLSLNISKLPRITQMSLNISGIPSLFHSLQYFIFPDT